MKIAFFVALACSTLIMFNVRGALENPTHCETPEVVLIEETPQVKPKRTLVEKISIHNMSTIEWEDEDWPNEPYADYLKRCMNYQRDMMAAKKRRIVFNLLNECTKRFDTIQSNVLDDRVTWDDLNLFRGQAEKESYFANILNRTTSEIGTVTFLKKIAQPITDVAELEKRQALIKEFIANEDLFDKLDKALNDYKKAENIVLSFWGNDLFKHSLERQYFNFPFFENINNRLNNEQVALALKGSYDHSRRISFFVMSSLATMILPIYGLTKLSGYTGNRIFNTVSKRLTGSGGPLFALLSLFTSKRLTGKISSLPVLALLKKDAVQGLMSILAGVYSGSTTKEEYQWMRDNFALVTYLQEKLMDVALFVKVLENLKEVVTKNSTLSSTLPSAKAFAELLDDMPKEISELQECLTLLKSRTFEGDPSIFSNQGKILVAYGLFHRLKNVFEKSLYALGELDAYMSVARLMKEFEKRPVGFSFVQFSDMSKPLIKAKDFWNPFIDPERVITSSLSIGDDEAHIAIVSGPNAGGKSTAIKSVAMNLILAQTFGIAAAKEFVVTPLSKIATYLNITDDIGTGNSLFKAQVMRIEELFSQTRHLKDNQFWFLAIDEMFNGTSAKEGQALSYSVAKDLGNFKNNICILATHFPMLTALEKQNTNFVNYKVSAVVGADGKIIYSFKLEPGASTQNVAIDICAKKVSRAQFLKRPRNLLAQQRDGILEALEEGK